MLPTQRYTFPLTIGRLIGSNWQTTPLGFRKPYEIHRLGTPGGSIHSMVLDRIAPEFREWLELNEFQFRLNFNDITFYDEAAAFAFKMRWTGSPDAFGE